MNLIGTLLDTNKMSAKDIVMDPFGNKLNHNYSVINETSMNDIDIYPFLNKLNHNHSVIAHSLDTNLIDRAPFGQIKSP